MANDNLGAGSVLLIWRAGLVYEALLHPAGSVLGFPGSQDRCLSTFALNTAAPGISSKFFLNPTSSFLIAIIFIRFITIIL